MPNNPYLTAPWNFSSQHKRPANYPAPVKAEAYTMYDVAPEVTPPPPPQQAAQPPARTFQAGADISDLVDQQYGVGADVTDLINSTASDPAESPMATKMNTVESAAQHAGTIGPDRGWGEAIRENLPMIGGVGAGIVGAVGGLAAAPAVGLAGLAAMGGKGYQDLARFASSTDFNGSLNPYKWTSESPTAQQPIPQNLPVPTSLGQSASEMGQAGLVNGVLPELMGQGMGLGFQKAGNALMRIGAPGRNAKLIESKVNPQGTKMAPSGANVGKPMQRFIAQGRKAEEVPLQEKYTDLLQGPFGQARGLEVRETGPQVVREGPVITDEVPGKYFDVADESFDVAPDSFEVGPVGPSIAERHSARSEALAGGRRTMDRDPNATRLAMKAADTELQEITKIAEDNGLDPSRYMQLNAAYKQVQEKFGNKFVRSMQDKTGANFIDALTKPKTWKTFKGTEGEGAGRIRLSKDQPELLSALKDAIGDPAAWQDLQTAVQKNILRKSTDAATKEINPTQLAKHLRDMIDGGAKELVPASGDLMKYAAILAKHAQKDSGIRAEELILSGIGSGLAGAGNYPGAGVAFGLAGGMRGYRALSGMGTPDLARAAAQQAGYKGPERMAGSMVGRLGIGAAEGQYEKEKDRAKRYKR